MAVRVRIAPSPTGDPHVGTAYVALFNWAFARKNGGQFVLRIEDTDRARSTPESEVAILRSLEWLGIDWDEGPDVGGPYAPYFQSQRKDIYLQHIDRLIESGDVYRCYCTKEELAAKREAALAEGRKPAYDRTCRNKTEAITGSRDPAPPQVRDRDFTCLRSGSPAGK